MWVDDDNEMTPLTTPCERLLHRVRLTPAYSLSTVGTVVTTTSVRARCNDAGRDLNDISSRRLRGACVEALSSSLRPLSREMIAFIPLLPTFSRAQSPSGLDLLTKIKLYRALY